MKRYHNLHIIILALALTWLSGCVKDDFDIPPVGELPVGKVYTISQLRQMYNDSGSIQINYDASVYATVTMDESTGNIYKSAYIQDADDAVNLHKTGSGGLRVGDSIRVYLKGVVLNEYHGMFQLDNVDPDSNIVILATEKYVTPVDVTIPDLNSGNFTGKLIRLENVQFNKMELGKTWADANNSANRTLEDCNGNTIIVRTSSYASFAEQQIPEGNGEFVAIAGVYDATMQLYVRSLSEIVLDGERCEGGGGGGGGEEIQPVQQVNEGFDAAVDYEDIDLEGWSNIIVAGDRAWTGKSFDGNHYAQASGYNSGLDDMETWLITPPVVNTNGDKKLSLKTAKAYWSHNAGNKPFAILVSTDYDGTNFESANWTDVSDQLTLADENTADHQWVESGVLSLANYTGNVSVAFKYKGSDSESTSYRIDDVLITNGDGGGGGGNEDVLPNLNEAFDDYQAYDEINKNGWKDIIVAGDRAWIGKIYDGNHYAQATGYNSNLDDMETWIITPLVDNANGDKVLTFKSFQAHWAHGSDAPLEIYISTDFTGDNFETATWNKLNPTLPTADDENYAWVESGDVDLSNYSGNIAVAFRYKGSNTQSTSIAVDDVIIE